MDLFASNEASSNKKDEVKLRCPFPLPSSVRGRTLRSQASAANLSVNLEEQRKVFNKQQESIAEELRELEAKKVEEIRERTAPIQARLTREQKSVARAASALEDAKSEMKAFENQAR